MKLLIKFLYQTCQCIGIVIFQNFDFDLVIIYDINQLQIILFLFF